MDIVGRLEKCIRCIQFKLCTGTRCIGKSDVHMYVLSNLNEVC